MCEEAGVPEENPWLHRDGRGYKTEHSETEKRKKERHIGQVLTSGLMLNQ